MNLHKRTITWLSVRAVEVEGDVVHQRATLKLVLLMRILGWFLS